MKVLPSKSIRRVSIALLAALIILIISLQVTIYMSRKKMEAYAVAETEQKSAFINSVTNMMFLSNEWILNGFMAGFMDVVRWEDPVTKTVRYKYCLYDDKKDDFDTDEIYERLSTFLTYQNEFYDAVMVFEPNVIKDASNGIAAMMRPGNKTRFDLLGKKNIYETFIYRKVKEAGEIVFLAGYINDKSTFVSTIGIPLYDQKGNFIGEFWIDTDAGSYSDLLVKYRKDKNAVCAIINNKCRIISSINKQNNGKYIKDISVQVYGVKCTDEWYSQLQSSVQLDTVSHFVNNIEGETIVTYIFPIKNSEYKLLILKPEKELYLDVERFMWIPNTVMFLSVFMISLCLIYIFVVYKKKNDENDMMEGELNVAADIQRGILPLNPQIGENKLYDIYGFQRQAKTVGGDLYDFVRKGDLLHFCIGDVSGKGMPAALVMTELCSLYRYVITHYSSPEKIVTKINKAVMERSDDSMLCTLFVGVLNLKTGVMEFCNAGHNPPIFIRKADETTKYLTVQANMPIYAFENYVYKKETLRLEQGDRLFLYTDGVIDAKNAESEFYGMDATLQTVGSFRNMSLKDIVRNLMMELKAFSNRTEQGDDITILCVEYKRTTECVSLHFDSVKNRVTEIVSAILDTCGFNKDMRLRFAIEEPVQNIADYAYENDGPLDVDIENNDKLEITLIDSGKPFNPLECKLPDINAPIMEREVGGLGIYLTQEIMDDLKYQYLEKQNRLTLIYKKNEH